MATCTADLKVKMTPQERLLLAELAERDGFTMGGWLRWMIRREDVLRKAAAQAA
jgi:hypothetical protein